MYGWLTPINLPVLISSLLPCMPSSSLSCICSTTACMVLITGLAAMQAKEPSFLHVFHHSVVVVMAFLWLEAAQSLQQIALLVNTSIHVLMYWYVQKHPCST